MYQAIFICEHCAYHNKILRSRTEKVEKVESTCDYCRDVFVPCYIIPKKKYNICL